MLNFKKESEKGVLARVTIMAFQLLEGTKELLPLSLDWMLEWVRIIHLLSQFWLDIIIIIIPDVAKREAYCSGNGFESFDPGLVKNYKWQQNYAILNEDFVVHMRSSHVSEHDIDYSIKNVPETNQTFMHPSLETMYI